MRRTLGVRTVFNLLGPLVNPLRPTGQVIGVFNSTLLETMAQALQQLGTHSAIALHASRKARRSRTRRSDRLGSISGW